MSRIIITNNPDAWEKYREQVAVELLDTGYLGVLERVRDKIHGGCRLPAYPMTGRMKPNQTPVRTLLLEERGEGAPVDVDSLQIIESAFASYEKYLKFRTLPNPQGEVLAMHRRLDLEHFDIVYRSLTEGS